MKYNVWVHVTYILHALAESRHWSSLMLEPYRDGEYIYPGTVLSQWNDWLLIKKEIQVKEFWEGLNATQIQHWSIGVTRTLASWFTEVDPRTDSHWTDLQTHFSSSLVTDRYWLRKGNVIYRETQCAFLTPTCTVTWITGEEKLSFPNYSNKTTISV